MKELTFEDAIPFIQRIPDYEKLTLVGGQALCFWTEFYSEIYPDLFDEHTLITTQDIDFLGNQDVVRECAEAWNGRHEIADIDDHSPNSGIVIIDYADDELRIDFLWQVQGMDKPEIEKERFQMLLPINKDEDTPFYILSPFLCLVSRVANVLTLNRTDQHSLEQLEAAIIIVKCLIFEYLKDGEEDAARDIAESVFKLAVKKTDGIKLFTEYGIDIFEAVPHDERFHSKFLEYQYPMMLGELRDKRETRSKHLKHRKNT